jgi:hypothetical protein
MKYYILLKFSYEESAIPYAFFPGERDKSSTVDNSFGNWFKVIPNDTSLEILQQSSNVEGMVMLEGGNTMISLPGYCIFETKEEARSHINDERYYVRY